MSIGRGYDWIHDLKNATGKLVPDLLALSRNNDPFFIGSAADVAQGKWFATMWERKYKNETGIHIRRVHYHLGAIGFRKLDGMPYTNCKGDWLDLVDCSKAARLLGLVPADAFEDHRNSSPHELNWRRAVVGEPGVIYSDSQFEWFLPSVRLNFSSLNWTLDSPSVHGYDPDDYLDRAYLLEIWIEKSTMNDILVPLTDELGVRLVPSSGFQSISNIVRLLERVRATGKPARIFYVSDHDKAGRHMPVSVSRQIEFWLPEYAPDADVKLQPLVLTSAQIAKYKLPYSVDGKKSVELDALEAIVPGELEKIVRRAVAPYLDDTVEEQLAAARKEAKRIVCEEWSELMEPYERKLKALHRSVQSVAKKYQKQAAGLNKRMERDLVRFKKPLEQLRSYVASRSNDFNPSLPLRPAQATSDQDERGWLFDSSRPYLDQLAFYKAHKSGHQR